MLLDMLEKSCVMAVIAYLLLRTKFFVNMFNNVWTLREEALAVGVFISFSLYGAANGLQVGGNVVALLHSGAILAGLLAGPKLGLTVGSANALIRYSLGGEHLALASFIAFLSGAAAGAYHHFRGGRIVTVREAALFTALFEVFARCLALAPAVDKVTASELQFFILVPMLFGNVAMVAIFIFVVATLREERRNRIVRERLEAELSMARDIQLSLVPKEFGPFPEHSRLAIYGLLEPAREVGGDIYDFFFLDKDRLCFMIGDVSGKGMPAALLMAATRTLFKAQADREDDIAEIVTRVNKGLCRGNESVQFVTLFCGILNLANGELKYCNAGHNPPYLRDACGRLELLCERHGPAAGVDEDSIYASTCRQLLPGDMLLLYTDGVTEAQNEKAEMFSAKGVERLLQSELSGKPDVFIPLLMQAVVSFADGAEQFDDVTMLALTYASEGDAKQS